MHKFLMGTLMLAITTLNAAVSLLPVHEAFVPKFSDAVLPNAIDKTPPPPRREAIPAKTYDDALWIPGYFAWIEANQNYEWVCGVWRRPPMNHFWIPGNWENTPEGWRWAKGFWSASPLDQIEYIIKEPPTAITDKTPPTPGGNYFWAPGYWSYSKASNSYLWLTGKWIPANLNWILAPSAYIWRPNGYIFAPFYWDWPLETRGTAYNCTDSNSPLITIEPSIIVQRIFFCYPDYSIFYCQWWQFNPEWAWEGCGCVPPWWFWHDWWNLSWSDCWGLWWWWGHPGSLPPSWLSAELSLTIIPPHQAIIDLLKNISRPMINIRLGHQPLLPKGTENKKDVPLPQIPNNVTPGGEIILPPLPEPLVTVPLPPPPPVVIPPTYPQEPLTPPPSTYYPPADNTPPVYYPPEDRHPPRYPPPRTPRPPRPPRPPQDHDHPRYPRPDSRPGYLPPRPQMPNNPNTTPPQSTNPNLLPKDQGRITPPYPTVDRGYQK